MVKSSNCLFSNNYAASSGGAIYLVDHSIIDSMPNCIFYENVADNGGGGLFI
jgi:predicted outer membrane repeat protein